MSSESNETAKMGKGMILIAWVLALVMLTMLFNKLLLQQENPNQQVEGVMSEDGRREVVLQRNRHGHYVANGRINGVPVTFLLDTGATSVAIPERIAERLSLERMGGSFTQTANGTVAVWNTRLSEVSLGTIRLNDVRAVVMPADSGLEEVLLGMSFLKQIEFTQREGELLLRQ